MDWQATAILDVQEEGGTIKEQLVDLIPGHVDDDAPLRCAAIDIGTTTVTLWLVELITGKVEAQVSEYNGQTLRSEDVISRIIYANKDHGDEELRRLVLDTITLIETACKRVQARLRRSSRLPSPATAR